MLSSAEQIAPQAAPVARNHPLAFRMATIAFINQNITVACVWGSFSVLLGAVETRLGIGRELSTLAVPAVSLATAGCAPIVGALATRHSLRLVMLVGSMLSAFGFVLLALTSSYPLYLAAFGLLLGPGMAVGAILPVTLTTRWYAVNRGRALGIVCAPIMTGLVPLGANWMVQSHGLIASYTALAVLSVVPVSANFFIVDHPLGTDGAAVAAGGAHGPAAAGSLTMAQLLRAPRYWALMLAYISSITGSVVITSHMVPMVQSWGMSATLGATLLSFQSLAGIAGTLLFGWLADKLGGVRALALLLFDAALLWAMLLVQPTFAVAAVIIGLIGVHGAGVLPVMGVALSEGFGRASFGRAYGLVNLINLPFAVLCVPAAALVYAKTGSYAGAIVGQAVFLGLGSLLAFSVKRGR